MLASGRALLEIVPLETALDSAFWEHVGRDIPHYYFFAFDWKYDRDATKILLALEDDRIDGMMLIYKKNIVQLRGSCKAVKALLQRLDLLRVELQALELHKEHILERYEPKIIHNMMLMVLNEGEEMLRLKHPIVMLDASDAEQIATIMMETNLEFWGTTTKQMIVEGMNRGGKWFGMRINEELVSVGGTRLTEWGGVIGAVATYEAHRNKGFAASIVSRLVKHIFADLSMAMIFVLRDNIPAVRVYEKVGFKPYRTYFFIRGERRTSESRDPI